MSQDHGKRGPDMNIEWALRGIARGDKGSFSTLYADQRILLVRYATGLLAGDREAAADVVDEAFVDVWQQAGRFAGNGSAQGWLRRIVRNKSVDWIRKQRIRPLATDEQSRIFESVADSADTPDDAVQKKSDAHELRLALDRLSMDHREVVWLCYFEELPLSEIASIVGCPENTVKTRLFHARKQLRAELTV
jgi:RNA polymerase sigma-70 factor, ECF subfamily